MRRNNGPQLRGLDLALGTWYVVPSAPLKVRDGGAVAWANGKLFVLRGMGATDFMAHSPEFVPTARLFLPVMLRESGP